MKLTKKIKAEIISWVDLKDIKEFAQKNSQLVQEEENRVIVTGVVIVPMRNNFDLILFERCDVYAESSFTKDNL